MYDNQNNGDHILCCISCPCCRAHLYIIFVVEHHQKLHTVHKTWVLWSKTLTSATREIDAEERGDGRNPHAARTVWAREIPVWATENPVAQTVTPASRTLQCVGKGIIRGEEKEFLIELTNKRSIPELPYLILSKLSAPCLRYFRPRGWRRISRAFSRRKKAIRRIAHYKQRQWIDNNGNSLYNDASCSRCFSCRVLLDDNGNNILCCISCSSCRPKNIIRQPKQRGQQTMLYKLFLLSS